MATTHYSELKAFALSTPGVENASVEFDVEIAAAHVPAVHRRAGQEQRLRDFSRKLGLAEGLIDEREGAAEHGGRALRGRDRQRGVSPAGGRAGAGSWRKRRRQGDRPQLRDEAELLRREMEARAGRQESCSKAKDGGPAHSGKRAAGGGRA